MPVLFRSGQSCTRSGVFQVGCRLCSRYLMPMGSQSSALIIDSLSYSCNRWGFRRNQDSSLVIVKIVSKTMSKYKLLSNWLTHGFAVGGGGLPNLKLSFLHSLAHPPSYSSWFNLEAGRSNLAFEYKRQGRQFWMGSALLENFGKNFSFVSRQIILQFSLIPMESVLISIPGLLELSSPQRSLVVSHFN